MKAQVYYSGQMVFTDEMVEVELRSQRKSQIQKLLELGYELQPTIYVHPSELPDGSHKRVQVICPHCREQREARHQSVTRKNNTLCRKCSMLNIDVDTENENG